MYTFYLHQCQSKIACSQVQRTERWKLRSWTTEWSARHKGKEARAHGASLRKGTNSCKHDFASKYSKIIWVPKKKTCLLTLYDVSFGLLQLKPQSEACDGCCVALCQPHDTHCFNSLVSAGLEVRLCNSGSPRCTRPCMMNLVQHTSAQAALSFRMTQRKGRWTQPSILSNQHVFQARPF